MAAPRNVETSLLRWRDAVAVRDEWLGHALDTKPADRAAAEAALTGIYARVGRSRPDFVWVDSPLAARPEVAGLPTLDDLYAIVTARTLTGHRPIASDLAASVSRLRSALDERTERVGFDPPPPKRNKGEPWPAGRPEDRLRAGVPFREVVRVGVRESLAGVMVGLHEPVRAALGPDRPVSWYGQLDAYWVAWHDLWRRLGMSTWLRADDDHFEDWATLARSTGWWWPDETRCVLSERPVSVDVRPVTSGWHGEVRPVRTVYRDGFAV